MSYPGTPSFLRTFKIAKANPLMVPYMIHKKFLQKVAVNVHQEIPQIIPQNTQQIGHQTTIRRIITKPGDIRKAIHSKVMEAVRRKFPIAGRHFTAELRNVDVRFSELSHKKQSELLLTRHNATDGVYADIDITDNASGMVVGHMKNKRICNIPYYTNRYTLMLDGNEYAVVSQMRTKSGVYTRKRGNDEIESSFNLAKGANFKLIMDPDTGVFKVDILNATLLAVAVLKVLGAGSQDITNALGQELAEKNLSQLTASSSVPGIRCTTSSCATERTAKRIFSARRKRMPPYDGIFPPQRSIRRRRPSLLAGHSLPWARPASSKP